MSRTKVLMAIASCRACSCSIVLKGVYCASGVQRLIGVMCCISGFECDRDKLNLMRTAQQKTC